jgi:copper homeostasis protein CutC
MFVYRHITVIALHSATSYLDDGPHWQIRTLALCKQDGVDFHEPFDFCRDPSKGETLWEVTMAAIAKVLSRAFTASQTTRAETPMMLVAFGLVGLVISVLLANYGLDVPVDYSF